MSEAIIKHGHIALNALPQSENNKDNEGSTDEWSQTQDYMKCKSGDESSEDDECITTFIKLEPRSHSCSSDGCTSINMKQQNNKEEEMVQNTNLPEFVHCNGSFPGTSRSSVYVKQEAVTEKSSEFQPVFCSIKRSKSSSSSFATSFLNFLTSSETCKNSASISSPPKVARLIDEAEEQYNGRCKKLRLRYLKWQKNETPNQREERLKKMRDRGKSRRGKETEEQRENRLQKLRLRQTQRLINETHEQKEHRLRQMRLRASRRLANESPEQREVRLSKMRQNAAKRLSNETREEREVRLSMLRSYRSRHLEGKVRQSNTSYFPQLPSGTSNVQECGISLNHSDYLTETETLERLQSANCSLNEEEII